jgi:class 3 adenylate cyclase
MRDLIVNSLRMRPDRVIFGEIRAGEAFDVLQLMDIGLDGTLFTVHANSPHDALTRFETMALIDNLSLPLSTIRHELASVIDLIIYQERLADGSRKLLNVTEVVGMQGDTIVLQDIFQFRQTGIREGRITGYHTATGAIPRFLGRLRDAGIELPLSLFTPRAHKTVAASPRQQVVTALSGDIKGFVAYSQNHPPEHVADMLKAYFERIDRIVQHNGGVVHKYLGDAFLALFGTAQRPLPDHAFKAVMAALQIRQEMSAWHETLPPDDGLATAFCINTGPVVASSIGSEGRTDYFGDALNLATLLQSVAARGQILIGENTAQLVKAQVEISRMPNLLSERRQETTLIYQVNGLFETS